MISIIIPSFNRARTIGRSIESVLKQTITDFELIVVDDGSLDETKEIVHSYNDPRIKYFWQKNSGACAARNLGISKSSGEYIAFQDSDDEWMPHKLERQLECMGSNNPDLIACAMRNKNQSATPSVILKDVSGFITDGHVLGASTQTFFGKREVFEKTLFDPKMPRLQDFDFLIRAQMNYSIYYMAEELVLYDNNFGENNAITSQNTSLFRSAIVLSNKYQNVLLPKKAKSDISDCIASAGKHAYLAGVDHYDDFFKLAYKMQKKPRHFIKLALARLHLYGFFCAKSQGLENRAG